MPTEKKTRNPWMVAFLLLLALVIGGILIIFVKINHGTPSANTNLEETMPPDFPVATITTDKEKANELIRMIIPELGNSGGKFQVQLEDTMIVTGSYTVIGFDLAFNLEMEPQALPDGNIRLRVVRFSVGSLPLPAGLILTFISQNLELPDYIQIDGTSEIITVRLDQHFFGRDMQIRAKEINLPEDRLEFELHIVDTPEPI